MSSPQEIEAFAVELETLAAYLRQNKGAFEGCNSSFRNEFYFFKHSGVEIGDFLGRGLGQLKKIATDDWFILRRELTDNLSVGIYASRSEVCERIESKVTLPAEPEQVIPAKPEREVTKIEWRCPDRLQRSFAAPELAEI